VETLRPDLPNLHRPSTVVSSKLCIEAIAREHSKAACEFGASQFRESHNEKQAV